MKDTELTGSPPEIHCDAEIDGVPTALPGIIDVDNMLVLALSPYVINEDEVRTLGSPLTTWPVIFSESVPNPTGVVKLVSLMRSVIVPAALALMVIVVASSPLSLT